MSYRRGSHLLTGNHKCERPGNIIYFDSEARVDMDNEKYISAVMAGELVEKPHDVFLICACFVRRSGVEAWQDYHRGTFKRRFWRDVDTFTLPGQKTWVIAHNAKYDTLATGAVVYLVRRGYKVQSFSDDNPFILKLSRKVKGKTKTILIISSTNYYKNSLAELGRTFGLPKLEGAFNDTLKKAVTYCRRDVEILKKAMTELIYFIGAEDLGNFAMTVAGQSFAAFRHRFLFDTEIFVHADPRALLVERAAYCGGRTEVWTMGEIPGEVYCLDVNSQYPAVMLHERYPVRLKTIRNKLTPDQAQGYIDRGFLLCANCTIITDLPLFPVKAGRLIFPVGEFETSLCTPEIIEGIKRGLITELKEVCIYEGSNIFAEFVDYFYHKRLEAKHSGDQVRDLFYKLILNSLYGKFGQKSIDWEMVGDAPPDMIKVERLYDFATGTRRLVKIFGGSVFKDIKKEGAEAEASNSFPAVAAHVTSYARMLLWGYIETAGIDNVFYMDTDSIFCNRQGLDNLTAAGSIDTDKLGSLKLEKQGAMKISGVKDYIFNDVEKLKGIPKGAIRIDVSTFIVNQWVGYSKMMNDGQLEGYKNILIKKHLSRNYTKGYITDSGQVLPLHFSGDALTPFPGAPNWTDLAADYCKPDLAWLEQEREAARERATYNKKVRAIIRGMGVNDRDYEYIPRWCKRKKGYTLSEINDELAAAGFMFPDAGALYEYIKGVRS